MLSILGLVGQLFTSNAMGSLLGWLGGLANRWVDFKTKQLDIQTLEIKNKHELALRDKDMEQVKVEAESKLQLAVEEGKTVIEKAAYDALSESYKSEAEIKDVNTWVNDVRAMVRPVTTAIFTIAALIQVMVIFIVAFGVLDLKFTPEQIFELVKYSVMWVFFQAGVVVGWYYANRPSSPPQLPKL